MSTSKKVTELTAAISVTADDLVMIVNDPTGTPESQKATVKTLLESNVTSNVVANGFLVVSGQAVANSLRVTYSSTPANATNVPAGFSNGTIWSDGSYVYVVVNNALKRAAVATW